MIKSEFVQNMSEKLSQAVPSQAKVLKDDLQANFHSILQGAFAKLDIVTREEFDAQTKVLLRTREKLEALTQRVAELEALTGK